MFDIVVAIAHEHQAGRVIAFDAEGADPAGGGGIGRDGARPSRGTDRAEGAIGGGADGVAVRIGEEACGGETVGVVLESL